ncbi:MAG: TolC family protein [Cyanobacteria bacterium RUI128]|nr:TolC family protein [Cyanobacteria bacterium RUI128]
MVKKILSLILSFVLLSSNLVFAEELGKSIIKDEYPDSDLVAPVVTTENENVTVHGSVQNTLDVTLEDCLKFALGNNPRIQAAIQDVFASDARIKQAWSNWFPQVSWQTGYTRIRQLQLADALGRSMVYNYYTLGQISLSEMLYDFGVTQNQVTIRKLENEQYKIMLTETINDVICDVKNAYYNVLYVIEQKKVAEEMVKRYELFYDQAKAYYTAGTKPKVDLTIAQVNLSNSKLNLIEAENAVDIAMAKLNNAMGLPYIMRYNIKDVLKYNPCSVTLDGAVEIAKEARPDYKLASVKVETAKQNVKLTKKSWAPQLSVEGQFEIGGKSFTSNHGYNFGAYLNFPTVNGMRINQEIKEAKSVHSREIANAMNTQNNIYLEIQNAYYALREKKNKIPVATVNVKQAKENYDLSFGRYRVGVGDPVELKEAQVQLQNAELQYYNTLYEYNCARANLEKAIGKNIVENQISLDLDKDKLKAENKKLDEQARNAKEEDKALRKQDAQAFKAQKIKEVTGIKEVSALEEKPAEQKLSLKDKIKSVFKLK